MISFVSNLIPVYTRSTFSGGHFLSLSPCSGNCFLGASAADVWHFPKRSGSELRPIPRGSKWRKTEDTWRTEKAKGVSLTGSLPHPNLRSSPGPSTACNTFCALNSLQTRAFCNESGTPAPGAVRPATGREVSFSDWTAGTALSAAASFRGVSHPALHLGWMMGTRRRNERRETGVNCLGEMGKGRGDKK